MSSYERPCLWELGSVRELTRQAGGKQFVEPDGSDFQGNFSCTRPDDENCSGGLPGQ